MSHHRSGSGTLYFQSEWKYACNIQLVLVNYGRPVVTSNFILHIADLSSKFEDRSDKKQQDNSTVLLIQKARRLSEFKMMYLPNYQNKMLYNRVIFSV